MTITLEEITEIAATLQIIDFFLQCDVVHNPRYEVATKIARELSTYIREKVPEREEVGVLLPPQRGSSSPDRGGDS